MWQALIRIFPSSAIYLRATRNTMKGRARSVSRTGRNVVGKCQPGKGRQKTREWHLGGSFVGHKKAIAGPAFADPGRTSRLREAECSSRRLPCAARRTAALRCSWLARITFKSILINHAISRTLIELNTPLSSSKTLWPKGSHIVDWWRRVGVTVATKLLAVVNGVWFIETIWNLRRHLVMATIYLLLISAI